MNKIIAIIGLSLSAHFVSAQNVSIEYKVEKNTFQQLFILDIDRDRTLFYSDEYCQEDVEERFNNTIIETKKGSENIKIHDQLENLWVFFEDKKSSKWTLVNETKSIEGIKLHKAKLHHKGTDWEAWYDANSPINSSPFTFDSLPGIIYEITSKDLKLSLVKISKQNRKCVQLPKNIKKVDRKVYDKYYKDLYQTVSGGFKDKVDVFGGMDLGNVLEEAIKKDLFRDHL